MLAYCGCDGRARLLTRGELSRVVCLDKANKNYQLAERIVWAILDPEARQWVKSEFYQQ